MSSANLKYKKIPQQDGGFVLRPIVVIELMKGKVATRQEALLDTGADICLFGIEIAELLGIDVSKGKPHSITGVGGKVTKGFLCDLGMYIPNMEGYKATVFFSEDITDHVGILGQLCFFDHFRVCFDYQSKRITIRSK